MSDNLNKLRSVLNKFTDQPNNITKDNCSDGEIVISNKSGQEGIFIKNDNGEIVMAAGNSLQYISKSEYDLLVENGEINENVYYMIYEE